MATSGIVKTDTKYDSYFWVKWSISGSQDITGNKTTIAWSCGLTPGEKYYTNAIKMGAVAINGVTVYSGGTYSDITDYKDHTFASGTLTIAHSGDGSKTFTVSAFSGWLYGNGDYNASAQSFTLPTIPRATTPTLSASSVNMGSAVTITLNRASSSFTHKLTYAFGSLSGQTSGLSASSGVGTSATFTPPLTLANQIPSTTSGKCTITCQTYNGSTLIGTKTVSLTLNVPSSVVPTISGVSISEATEGLATKFAAYVQNKSTLAVAITASGVYGSTIKNYETYIQAVPYRTASFTSNVITASGTIGVVTIVTDTRGRTAQVSNSVTILEYSPPEISALSAWRITTAGVASDEGTRIAMAMKFAISSVGGNNDHTYNFKYRKSTDTEFTSFGSGSASWSYDDTQLFTSAPEISVDNAYVIRVEIADYFQTAAYEVQIPTAFTIMDFRNTGKGMAIGKVSEKDALEVAMNSEFTGQVKIFAPGSSVADSGFIRMYRADGTLCAFLATSDGGDGLNLHFYSGGAWAGVVKFTKDGAIVAKNLSYGTATTG